jgi:hypothetical protein
MNIPNTALLLLAGVLTACAEVGEDTGEEFSGAAGFGSDVAGDTGKSPECGNLEYEPYPFATDVQSFLPGEGAGFGQDIYPGVVFGPPLGAGEGAGSLDVLSLGLGGELVLGFEGDLVDGPGPDLIVFENAFVGWQEPGVVSASVDGETWIDWPCDAEDSEGGFPGCAGVAPSLSHPDNCIDATDPLLAGGDAFDLSAIGLESAAYIRVRDAGSLSGGFDLDSIAIVNGAWD